MKKYNAILGNTITTIILIILSILIIAGGAVYYLFFESSISPNFKFSWIKWVILGAIGGSAGLFLLITIFMSLASIKYLSNYKKEVLKNNVNLWNQQISNDILDKNVSKEFNYDLKDKEILNEEQEININIVPGQENKMNNAPVQARQNIPYQQRPQMPMNPMMPTQGVQHRGPNSMVYSNGNSTTTTTRYEEVIHPNQMNGLHPGFGRPQHPHMQHPMNNHQYPNAPIQQHPNMMHRPMPNQRPMMPRQPMNG